MKLVLSIDEANKILMDYLRANGKLENKDTDIHWHMVNNNEKKSYVEFEQ